MRITEANKAPRSHHRSLCNALGLNPDLTSDATLNRAEERVEWTRHWEDVDVNAYEWCRVECTLPPLVTAGRYAGRGVTVEQRQRALEIDGQWLAQFPTETP